MLPILVFARGHHYRPIAQGPPPPPSSLLQIGFFLPPAGVPSQWTQRYTDGAFPSGSGNLEIYMEPPMNDASIISGKFDAQLKTFAAAAKSHQGQVVVAFGEEVNCSTDPWGGTHNTVQQTKDAFNHEAQIVKSVAPNVQIMFSVNNDSCYGLPSPSTYYPGSSFVDVVGLSGFNFGGQSWDSVFDHAIQPLQSLGKPIWAASEGSVDNQAQFVADSVSGAAKYNLPVVIYYNADQFKSTTAILQGL